jgi:peptidyl-dipeptidase Dcp
MAGAPLKVTTFLNELLEKAKPIALKEFKELENFAKKLDNIDRLEKWDSAYYSEKLKTKLFNLDDEKLKPYFKLENVIDGAFKVAKKLFGLNFKQVKNIDTYHEDVKTYNVTDENNHFTALFYADFHPRKGKRNGAWMTSFKGQKN